MLISSIVAALAVLCVLVAPGLPLVAGLRMRLLPTAALVAPASFMVIAVAAEIGHRWHLGWSIWLVVVVGLLAAAPLWLVDAALAVLQRQRPLPRRGAARWLVGTSGARRRSHGASTGREVIGAHVRPGTAPWWRAHGAPAAGLLIGGGSIVGLTLSMTGGIDAVSQTYDGIFHLNAVQYILQMHDASAFVVGGMTQLPGTESYYPALWHQAASLVALVGGQELPLSADMLMVAVAALVWPLGLMALVRHCTGAGPLGVLLTGAFAGISLAFPFALSSFGLLLPTFLSTALLPAIVLLLTQTLRIGGRPRDHFSPLALAVLVPTTTLAVALAHPQGVFGTLTMAVPILVWAILLRSAALVRPSWRALAAWAATLLAAGGTWLVITRIWTTLRPSQKSSPWGPTAELWQGIWNAVGLSTNGSIRVVSVAPALIIAVLVVAAVRRSRGRWMIAGFLGAATMSVLAQVLPVGDVRYFWTGPWYSDPFRLVALPVVLGIPLIALGVDQLASLVRGRGRAVVALACAAAVACLAFIPAPFRDGLRGYASQWQSPDLLSSDERALLEELPSLVPADAVIATNAWNGSSLAYAIGHRNVLNKTGSFQAAKPVHLLNGKLDEARTDPVVCDAAHDLHVGYALDFGPDEIWRKKATYTGLNEISETGSATLVKRIGDASLWKMKPCRGTDGQVRGF